MDDDDTKHADKFDAALPLPFDDRHDSAKISHRTKSGDTAVDLIRKRIDAVYASEPAAQTESKDIQKLGDKLERSKHQEFIYELTSSGKPLHEIQVAWHEYYAGLPEEEKHEVWQEFYNTHSRATHFPTGQKKTTAAAGTAEEDVIKNLSRPVTTPPDSLRQFRRNLQHRLPTAARANTTDHLRSLAFGLGVGAIVLVVFLFSFFNERFIAPFIQPSRNVTNTPIIAGSVVGPNPEVVIPKINVEIPVIYDINTINEAAVENALNDGVVHYADTALPGQDGNVVIVGHSSNNIFNPGKYKFAFVLLPRMEVGDTFYLQKDGKRYTYQVYKKEIVSPNDVSVLGTTDKPATATLITCYPPGTSNTRMVIIGQQIDPSPATNLAQSTNNQLATQSSIIPGNAPSLWSRFVKWLSY